MAACKVDTASLTAVADAIRTAAGSSASLTFPGDFVDAIEGLSSGGGSQLVTGVQTLTNATDFTLTNLPFTPTNVLLLLVRRVTTKGVLVTAITPPDPQATNGFGLYTNNNSGLIANLSADSFVLGDRSVTFHAGASYVISGVYFYAVWRSEEEGT